MIFHFLPIKNKRSSWRKVLICQPLLCCRVPEKKTANLSPPTPPPSLQAAFAKHPKETPVEHRDKTRDPGLFLPHGGNTWSGALSSHLPCHWCKGRHCLHQRSRESPQGDHTMPTGCWCLCPLPHRAIQGSYRKGKKTCGGIHLQLPQSPAEAAMHTHPPAPISPPPALQYLCFALSLCPISLCNFVGVIRAD